MRLVERDVWVDWDFASIYLFIYFICGCWNTFYFSGQPRAIILLPRFSAAQKKNEKAKYFERETWSFILKDSVK